MGCRPTKVAVAPPAEDVVEDKFIGGDSDQLNLPPGTCVVAIDFGTSRSAFSYGFVGPKGANVEINFGCPTDSLLNEGVAVKAETCVILDQGMKAVGFGLKGRKTLYAQKKEDVSHMFKWFKMYLKDIKSDADESVMVSDHNGKQVSLFLVITQALYYIAKSALDEVNAKSLSARTFQDIYWAVTVPAIWSAAASGFMRRAALKAGMITNQLSLKLMLVREPEAACLDLLNDIDKKSHPVQIPVGAEMLILDLGGGTNDMSFVKILSEDPLNCQELKEAAGGTGGAARIDQHVLNMLKDLFGEERFNKIEKLPALLDLMDMWETFKITFDGHMTFALKLGDMIDALQDEHPDEIINVEVINKLVGDYNNRHPPSERVSNVRLKIDIPEAVVCKWFNSVVDVIVKDLDTQLRLPACSGVNFLYLVGGFSSSKYLTEKVTDHIKKAFGHRSIIIFPATKPDVAIVRGAVRALLNARQPLISDHVSSKCYGIKTSMMYVPGKHDGSKIFYVDGNAMVSLYHMFVAKGDRLPLDYVTPEQVFSPQSISMTVVTLQLYTIDDITVKKDTLVYMDDPRLKLERALSVPLQAADYLERRIRVSIKFGMEIQLLAKDKLGKFYEAATSESYLS